MLTPRDRVALALMITLAMAILALLPIAKWHSAPSCDARTHIEMIRGVTEHGLPYGKNGAIERFPEMRARWNIVRDGKLWGTYPPLFAYVAAPIFRIGGLAAVSRMNIVFLLVTAIAVFFLAKHFLNDALLGAVAASLVVLSTPVPSTSIDMSPYVIAEALMAFAMLVALKSFDAAPERSRRSACFSGFLCGVAVSGHLLAFPMFAGLLVALAVPSDDVDARHVPVRIPSWVAPWIPTRASLARASAMIGGFAFALVPVAALNFVRFRSLNPISYGPCLWRSCHETGQDVQHLSDILLYALPSLVWLALTIAILFFLRKSRWRWLALLLFSVTPMIAWKLLRTHAWQILLIGWGNMVDLSFIDMEIGTMPDGIGRLFGPWVVRSALQCTPFLLLAAFVPQKMVRDRRRAMLLALPALALFVSCALRANEPTTFAFGWPFAFLRYTVLATMPLVVLAIAAVRELPWRRVHVASIVVVSIFIALELMSGRNYDAPLSRRVFLLYVPLAAALVSAATMWRARQKSETAQKLAPFAIAATIALGIGGNVGETFPAEVRLRNDNDTRLDTVASLVPQRFALVGFAGQIDTALALRATRDVEYVDLYETDATRDGWGTFRAMIDVWTSDGRPIFALWPAGTDPPSPWPDVAFERIQAKENLYRIRKL